MGMKSSYVKLLTVALALQIGCSSDDKDNPPVEPDDTEFFFGADLSYVNQILDKGGVYKVQNVTQDPYKISPTTERSWFASDCGTTRSGRRKSTVRKEHSFTTISWMSGSRSPGRGQKA